MQTPKVVGRGDRHFTLDGDIIDIFSKEHEVERVKSLGHGLATSDDITLKSDTIDLRLSAQKLQRAYSWGKSRAHAHSKDEDITADSIEVLMPDQVLRVMHAVRSAVAESQPDSLKIVSKKPDRLEGDTVIAEFDSLAAADTVKQPGDQDDHNAVWQHHRPNGPRRTTRSPATAEPKTGPIPTSTTRSPTPITADSPASRQV